MAGVLKALGHDHRQPSAAPGPASHSAAGRTVCRMTLLATERRATHHCHDPHAVGLRSRPRRHQRRSAPLSPGRPAATERAAHDPSRHPLTDARPANPKRGLTQDVTVSLATTPAPLVRCTRGQSRGTGANAVRAGTSWRFGGERAVQGHGCRFLLAQACLRRWHSASAAHPHSKVAGLSVGLGRDA
jgi:hypothetical protein